MLKQNGCLIQRTSVAEYQSESEVENLIKRLVRDVIQFRTCFHLRRVISLDNHEIS